MMFNGLLSDTITVYRRTVIGRDSLNNPIYGQPVSGTGWFPVYRNIPARLAFFHKKIDFSEQGERVVPTGVAYIQPGFVIKHEDRVLTADNIVYVVTGVTVGRTFNGAIDHYELFLELP